MAVDCQLTTAVRRDWIPPVQRDEFTARFVAARSIVVLAESPMKFRSVNQHRDSHGE